jgi:hypothetical protein
VHRGDSLPDAAHRTIFGAMAGRSTKPERSILTAGAWSLVVAASAAFVAGGCMGCMDRAGDRRYALIVHVVGVGGVGSLDDRINCTQSCDHDDACQECSTGDVYYSGQTVPLVASPEPGHPVRSIVGAHCAIDAPECIVTIVADAEVTFTFAP